MKQQVSTHLAPAAIGPYSQGIAVGNLLFVSGQVPVDPATGRLVEGEIEAQAERSIRNVLAIVEQAGFSVADIVKTTCLLADMADFPRFNQTYASYFSAEPPARETYQVAALPLGARVEISAICAR